ncbi:Alpha-glucan water dikinase, chloroplastic [Zea mays]|uniref:Alpha-glucan water dikinase, chloroplastic n=1 Tax=Zea mays TaxID=4577 RepID=A0A3L6DG56_MAIZE|nr:Alpha-glucan water dikinase, chloroplastic [Zea mays]
MAVVWVVFPSNSELQVQPRDSRFIHHLLCNTIGVLCGAGFSEPRAAGFGLMSKIGLEATNTSGSLILHCGILRPDKRDWILPSRQPDRTTVYKNRALRTPFVKLGHNSTLRIEIDDHVVQDIESLIFDDTHNKW